MNEENEQNIESRVPGNEQPEQAAEIVTNTAANPQDPAVVVDEPERTVVLTEDETIIIDKEPEIRINPSNRPQKVYGGMWGPTEIGVVGAGILAILASIFVYAFVVVPSDNAIEEDRLERQRLDAELQAAKAKYGDITNTEAHVAKLVSSIDDFESRYLPFPDNGKTALYQRLNALIAGYGLVNTTGPDYTPLEISELNSTRPENETGRAKYRSLFPGVYITVTLEGSYQNLRRFIREVETSNEFVVIASVELEPSNRNDGENAPRQQTETQTAGGVQPGIPGGMANFPAGVQTAQQPDARNKNRGVMHGQVISLRLEMAAYFRRQQIAETAAPEVSEQTQ